MPAHLTRHATAEGPRWALDGHYLPPDFTLGDWLAWPQADAQARLEFFYRRHSAWDERYGLYPVLRLEQPPPAQ